MLNTTYRRNNKEVTNDCVDFVLKRMEQEFACDDLDTYLMDEIDTAYIYADDQWNLLKYLCNPDSLNEHSLDNAKQDLLVALKEYFDIVKEV